MSTPKITFGDDSDGSVPILTTDGSNNLMSATSSATGTPALLAVATPTADNYAANKAYVDSKIQGLHILPAVRAATTSAGTLASDFNHGDSIDGVTLATNDRILIKDQGTASENGIYIVTASGSPTRATYMAATMDAASDFTFVSEGTVNGDHGFVCTSEPAIVGSNGLTFTQFSGAGMITASGGLTKTGNNLSLSDNINVTSNITAGGTLGVTGVTTLSNNATVGGTLGVTGVTTLSNNATVGGTLGVTGATTLSSNASVGGTLGVTGVTTLAGALNANGGIACDTNAFTVADTTGNTAIAGTLGVTGATTLSSTLGVTGAATLSSTLGVTGALTVDGGITCDVDKFTVADTTGNTAIAGTLGVTGATTLSSTLGVTGATTLAGALNANGGIACDTNKFTVADTTGNTAIAGTLGVTGATTLSSTLGVTGALIVDGGIMCDVDKFTVADTTGNTAIAGTLGVTGAATFSSSVSAVSYTTTSDRRKKHDIVNLDADESLEKIQQIQGVAYKRNSDNRSQIGFIAQDLEAVCPDVVETDSSEEAMKSVNYSQMVALLLEGMKAQQAQIQALQNRIEVLESA